MLQETGDGEARIMLERTPGTRPGQDDRVPAIDVDRLTKRYGDRAVVNELSFTVPAGGVTGFVGPNGAGKSTTMRMLLGLVRPTAGTARVLGQPVNRPQAYLSAVGALVEAPAAYPTLSGRQNLEMIAILKGADPGTAAAALQQAGLADRADNPVKTYSLGMRGRLSIAMALIGRPRLLILDEPVNGLDPAGLQEVRDLLGQLGDDGMTVFVSSHLLSEIERICHRLVILREGRAVFTGGTADLLRSRATRLLVKAEAEADYLAITQMCAEAGYPSTVRDGRLEIDCPDDWAGQLSRLCMSAGIVLIEVTPVRPQLEDVFLAITREKPDVAGVQG
jgi:ABC-2 type transport system ATP-binding protein